MAEQDGVRVSARPVEGRALPLLRAETLLEADPYRVMAVIQDVARHSEWIDSCVEATLLERQSERVSLIYTRLEVPWPLADRDAVLRTEFQVVQPGRELLASFALSDRLAAPARAETRPMERLAGRWWLVEVEPGRTRVVYELDADPGGLPGWLVQRAIREMPLLTLLNLRRQVRIVGERYRDWRAHWDPGWPETP